MAVKRVTPIEKAETKTKKARAKDSGMKPLAKYYLDEHPEKAGESFFVFQARMTTKGFLLLMCKDFTLMFPAGLEEPTNLLDNIFPNLHGKRANRLVAVLEKGNRFGAYLATDDEHQCYYSFDETEEILLTAMEPITQKSEESTKKLELADFGIDMKS